MGVFSSGFNVRECKLACIQAINRIKIFRNKQIAEEAACKKTVGDYLDGGSKEMGMMRIEQVIRIQNTLKALEILEVFLEMVKTRMEYLAKQKQIPVEMRTSLLSIAYAASRVNDIPELAGIRKQFESRFGREAFAEVTVGEPTAACGVQEKLLRSLSVDPPKEQQKVDVGMQIVADRKIECTRQELEEALGMFVTQSSIPPVPDDSFIPPIIDGPLTSPPGIPDPLQVNEFGNPTPAFDTSAHIPPVPQQAPPQQPAHVAAYPVAEQPAADAGASIPPIPTAQATAVPGASNAMTAPAVPSAAREPAGYFEAMKAAMSGATTGDKPVLDTGNPGPEWYAGEAVHGSVGSAHSMPAVPPPAAQAPPSDLLFPDVKWMDAPAPPACGAGSISDLPPAPSHDPAMPAAPRFSHTGAVYDPENGTNESVQNDLMERLKRLKQ